MKRLPVSFLLFGLLACGCARQPSARPTTESELLEEIGRIKAIDNHAHVPRVVREGEKADDEYDALPCPELAAQEPEVPTSVALRPDNPEYIAAWRALYGYPHDDRKEAHIHELVESKQRVMREQGDNYPTWALDKLGIETMLANRVAMGRGLIAPRFRWVSYVDALMLPLNNGAAHRANPNYHFFYDREENILKRYLAESKVGTLPATLQEYLARIVTATLERQKHDGALAVKFEAGYLRSLDFADVQEKRAEQVYARHIKSGEPPAADYKLLQDFLFRYIAREAGRLGLAVHIHTGFGCGSYYYLSGSNPLLLDSVFNDPTLRKTKFVMLHGGNPFTEEAGFLLGKPNVYVDFSGQVFSLSTHELGKVLRYWIMLYPEQILFGTDTGPGSPEISWEEVGFQTVNTSRKALAMALTAMMNDGEITRARALQLARMVLRENAIKLYGLMAH